MWAPESKHQGTKINHAMAALIIIVIFGSYIQETKADFFKLFVLYNTARFFLAPLFMLV